MTPHISSKKEDIAKTVLIAGDPKRTQFIAMNYLENPVLVNEIRGALAYTGTYKGKRVTVFTSGMGMPSMGIYSYELYKYYDVDNIIRIGSCGSNVPDIKLLDVILSSSSYNEGGFAYNFNNKDVHDVDASEYLNDLIIETSKEKNIDIRVGKTACCEVFDPYMEDYRIFLDRCPKDVIASEMEAFALFYVAKYFNRNAACLCTVSDSKYDTRIVSPEDRQNSLTTMIELALESTLKVSD